MHLLQAGSGPPPSLHGEDGQHPGQEGHRRVPEQGAREGKRHAGQARSNPRQDEKTAQWLDTYFEGADPGFTPPIRVEGSDFKKMVSSIMLSIPFGATSTYSRIAAEVARRTGRKQMSAQAVGGAVGRNPIVLIVPCHRVLASDGSLRGYAGGVDRKEWLLKREGVNMPGLSTPPDADDGGGRRE